MSAPFVNEVRASTDRARVALRSLETTIRLERALILDVALNIDELRLRARRKVPRAVFDFIDGAAEDEVTLRRNRAAFGQHALVPRVGVDVSSIDLSTSVLGQPLAAPLVLAPTGLCGMAASRGEIPVARAAKEAGIAWAASCLSSVTLEEIAREAPGEHWFQLYVWKDRAVTQGLIERAAASGYRVLVVTMDLPVLGQRERDVRNGATIPPRVTLRNAIDTLSRLPWLWSIWRGPRVGGGGSTHNPLPKRPPT